MVTLYRAQISVERSENMGFADITAKSAKGVAALFAPSWDMVMGHKSGTMTDSEYTERYYGILGRLSQKAWDWLLAQAVNDKLTIMCYCPVSKEFCHSDLLIRYASTRFPRLFQDGRINLAHEVRD